MDVELDQRTLDRIAEETGVRAERINVDVNIDLEHVEESYDRAIQEVIKAMKAIVEGNVVSDEDYHENF